MANPSTTFASLSSIQSVPVTGFSSWEALLRFHLGIVRTLALCGALGAAWKLFG
jgi:hypothetical protein